MCEDQGWSALELRVGSGQGGVDAAHMGLSYLGELCMEVGSLDLIPRVVYKLQGKQSCQERKSNQSILCGSAGKLITLFFLQGWRGGRD